MADLIRASYGTAIAMGLIRAKLLARPTTAYLMTYWPGRCSNDCAFCAQARSSRADLEKLSRVVWPAFRLEDVVGGLKRGNFARICLQTIDYPGMIEDVFGILDVFSGLNLYGLGGGVYYNMERNGSLPVASRILSTGSSSSTRSTASSGRPYRPRNGTFGLKFTDSREFLNFPCIIPQVVDF